MRSRATRLASRSPQATCRTSPTFKAAAGARPFRTRSTAARHPPWPTLRRWPRRPRHAISRLRSQQGRELQDRLERQRTWRRQPRQRLGFKSTGQLAARRFCGGGGHRSLKTGGNADEVATRHLAKQTGGHDGGSMTLLRPDGSEYPGSPFTGGGLSGPWVATIDGNDNVWVSNFGAPEARITQLCGVRTENCPPGFKTGEQISPPGGYVGGGLQLQTDLAISPSGDVWVINN